MAKVEIAGNLGKGATVGQGVAVGASVGGKLEGDGEGKGAGGGGVICASFSSSTRAIIFQPPIKPIILRAVSVILALSVNFFVFRFDDFLIVMVMILLHVINRAYKAVIKNNE